MVRFQAVWELLGSMFLRFTFLPREVECPPRSHVRCASRRRYEDVLLVINVTICATCLVFPEVFEEMIGGNFAKLRLRWAGIWARRRFFQPLNRSWRMGHGTCMAVVDFEVVAPLSVFEAK